LTERSLKLIKHSLKLTERSLKLTERSLKLTERSLKLTEHSLKWTEWLFEPSLATLTGYPHSTVKYNQIIDASAYFLPGVVCNLKATHSPNRLDYSMTVQRTLAASALYRPLLEYVYVLVLWDNHCGLLYVLAIEYTYVLTMTGLPIAAQRGD
jgi:hypothetical protein